MPESVPGLNELWKWNSSSVDWEDSNSDPFKKKNIPRHEHEDSETSCAPEVRTIGYNALEANMGPKAERWLQEAFSTMEVKSIHYHIFCLGPNWGGRDVLELVCSWKNGDNFVTSLIFRFSLVCRVSFLFVAQSLLSNCLSYLHLYLSLSLSISSLSPTMSNSVSLYLRLDLPESLSVFASLNGYLSKFLSAHLWRPAHSPE